MRIALFIDVFPRISNTFILNQITGLIDRGHEVDIFARAAGDFEKAHEDVARYRLRERMKQISIPSSWPQRALLAGKLLLQPDNWSRGVFDAFNVQRHGTDALSLVQLFSALSFARQPRYDVVHCQFGKLGPGVLPLLEARGLDEPLVVSFRGADLTRLVAKRPRIYAHLFERGQLFLPVSDNFRRRLIAAGCPEDRISVHHSGIMLNRFPYRERKRATGEPTRILFIGRLTEKKGVKYALLAVAELLRRGRSVRFTIVGDGEDHKELVALVRKLRISESVEMVGSETQDRVIGRLQESHILVAPSVTAADGDQEGIPNVVKEAMATGIPVVATRHSGTPELVEDGRSGFLVDERDADELAEKLGHLIDNPELWPEFGRAGRAKVEAEFDSDRLNDELVEAYRLASVRARFSSPAEVVKAAPARAQKHSG